jgi:peptide/nickel transport system substrate-binding protein
MTDILNSLSRRGLLLGGAAVVAGAGGLPSRLLAAAEPKRGGSLTFLVNPEPSALVNIATTAGPECKIGPKVTEGLLSYDFAVNPKPQLATSWSVSQDGTQYTFNLRQGVRWHDGQDFVSKDVATSIALLKQWHPRGRSTFANVAEVRTPDPHTAIIVLSKPAPYLLYALAASESPIVASHIYDTTSDPTLNPNQQAPIGTGPFKFKSWEKGSTAIYERNPDYWDQPKPYIDRLIVRFIPDPGARAAALETGELLLAGENPVSLSDVERLRALPQLGVTTDGYSYSADQVQIEFNLDNPYFKNLKVRQAVAHAIDRQVVLDRVWYGYGVIAPSPISPLLKQFYAEDVETYPYDPKKSELLLDEAGFTRGSDGTRFSVFHDFLPYGGEYPQLGAYIRQALQKVGINVHVRSQDFASFIKRVYTDRDYDFDSNGLSNTFDPTVGVQRVYWSKNFRKGVPFSNGSHYDNPAVDKLLEDAAVESDPKKRVEEFKEFQKIVNAEIPLINLITIKSVTIFDKRVKNHTVTADGLSGNLADVYLEG